MVSVSLKDLFSKTVFLFGAGASLDAGCKTSIQMLKALKTEILSLPVDDDRRNNFDAIYDFIIKSLVYQKALKDPDRTIFEITNIEDFVSVLRQMIDREYIVPAPLIGNWNSKITNWEIKNEKIFQDFLDFTYNCLINKWTKFENEKALSLIEPFRKLISLDDNFNISIFSLNYDLVFESSFNSSKENLLDVGFSQQKWTGDFTDPHNEAKIKLYKLHGSVDWYFDESEEEVKYGLPEGMKPLIVFGSGPKIQSYDPFLTLLSSFRTRLKEANLFIVVGYSFQDKYINNILIQSLSAGLNRKMIVVDPAEHGSTSDFVNKVAKFQSSKSLNEVVNLTRFSPDRVQIEKTTAKNFFVTYLGNNAKILKEKFSEVEAGDIIF